MKKLVSLSGAALSCVFLASCMFGPATTTAATSGASSLPAAATGANIDESKATQTLFVNNRSGSASDGNPGTEALPFRTVAQGARAAQTLNQRGIGVKVYIQPGIYREQVTLTQTSKDTGAPIIFEGTSRGNVILSGSDDWSGGWQPVSNNVYGRNWPYVWGVAPYPQGWDGNTVLQDIVRRREMVYVNGHNMTQVLQFSDLADYSFFADENAHTIYLRLGPGLTIDSTIEVGIRPRVLVVQGKQNLVLRDLVFRHGNAAVQDSAVQVSDSSNVLISGCTFEWNNWIGLGLSGTSSTTLSNNIADRNGATGFDIYNMKNLVLDSNETSFNNWRGARGNFYGWSVAGAKLGGVHAGRVSQHTSAGNRARGLWLDYDNRDVTVDGVTLVWNFNDGIFIEANPGPILVQNSTMANNQYAAGIAGANSSDVTLLNNVIIGNGVEQILITGDLDRTVVNWETNAQLNVPATRWTIRSNTVTSQDGSQGLLVVSDNWPPFLTTLSADYNVWTKRGGQQLFGVGSKWLTFGQWQSLVNADLTSVLQP
jgi:parallel beta-helix repeat protein